MELKLPASVQRSTLLAYKPKNNIEPKRKLKSEVFDWDVNHPKTLVCFCMEQLSKNWIGMFKNNNF